MTLDGLICKIRQLLEGSVRIIIAIDGPCGAGKTTLAEALSRHFDCNVFHTDDFFLRPEQRTPDRLAEPGGNLDRERFLTEVVLPLADSSPFAYRPYDCKTAALGPAITVEPRQLNIVEGSYSCHPAFGDYCDLRIYVPVSDVLQSQRIRQRPKHLQQRFFQEWIPMERHYFDTFGIPKKCHIQYEEKP